MIKQRLFTALGIAFSILIVFGGWLITSKLLESHEISLLSTVGSVEVTTQTSPPSTQIDEANYPTLTDSEVYTVLNIWELATEEIPHEPKEGQLSMEQAIAAGKAGLSFFSEHGIIPSEFIVYDKTNAYLCESGRNFPQLIETNSEINPEDIRSREELEAFYSYWTVSFSSGKSNATLVINAVTGQIWKAKMEYPVSNNDLEGQDDKVIADTFLSYLELKENTLFESIVQKNSVKIDNDTLSLSLDIHLATRH